MNNTQINSDANQKESKTLWAEIILGRSSAGLWIWAAVLGAVSISLFGTPEAVKAETVFLRLSIPILIIAIYARLGYKDVRRAKNYPALQSARVGQLADSVYFLGFLWTLWALIDSFVLHDMTIVEAVFRAFGYALVTTTSGMFLRLALLQFSYSTDIQILVTPELIEKELANFSNTLRNTNNSINGFQTQTDTVLSKWIISLNESTTALKVEVDNVNKQTTDLKSVLVEMQKNTTEHVNKLIESALSQFSQKLQSPIESVNDNVKKMETSVKKGVEDIERTVRNGTGQVQAELANYTKEINSKLTSSSQALEEATTSLVEALPKQMASIVLNLKGVSDQLRNIYISPAIVDQALEQQVTAANASMMKGAKLLQEAIEELKDSIIDAAQQIRSEVRRLPWWKRILGF